MTVKFENGFGREVELHVTQVAIEFRNVPVGATFSRQLKGYTEMVWKKISETEARDAYGTWVDEFNANETVDATVWVTK